MMTLGRDDALPCLLSASVDVEEGVKLVMARPGNSLRLAGSHRILKDVRCL